MKLTAQEQVTAADLWPLARKVARRLWRDEQSEGVAAEALCRAVAGVDPADDTLPARVCRRVFCAVLNAAKRHHMERLGARQVAAPDPGPAAWEVLPADELAAVEAFIAEPGDRRGAEGAAAHRLGIKRDVYRRLLDRAERRLMGAR